MVQTLSFTDKGGVWEASYTSAGDTVVQLARRGGDGRKGNEE